MGYEVCAWGYVCMGVGVGVGVGVGSRIRRVVTAPFVGCMGGWDMRYVRGLMNY